MNERVEWTPERIKREVSDTCWNYQKLAARTIPDYSDPKAQITHASFGIVAEVQEAYDAWDVSQVCEHCSEDFDQNEVDELYRHLYRELGDICWMAAELITGLSEDLQEMFAHMYEYADTLLNDLKFRPYGYQADNLFGRMRSEAATIASEMQHTYQGRPLTSRYLAKVIIRLYSEIAVLACIVMANKGQDGITPGAALDAVLQTNIVKLRKRYPGAGWDLEHDVNRAEDDT